MDLENMIKAHSDYSQSYPGHNKGCKICFILAEVERLKGENKRFTDSNKDLEFNNTEFSKICEKHMQTIKKLREALELALETEGSKVIATQDKVKYCPVTSMCVPKHHSECWIGQAKEALKEGE